MADSAHIVHDLEEVVEKELNRHLAAVTDWMPHEYVNWSDGRNYPRFFEDGEPWQPDRPMVTDLGRTALVVNLLTEDNLPSYHREIANRFGPDAAWTSWINRWTAEEGRHGIVLRDYLLTSRAVDPDQLERLRMSHVAAGYESDRESPLHEMAYLGFQELATRISHRNTGRESGDPVCERLLTRVAVDENLHMLFYRNLLKAALEITPDAAMQAVRDVVTDFRMPGYHIPGFQRAAVQMAVGGIYNVRIHLDEVLQPMLRHLKVFDIGGLGASGRQAQEDLGEFIGTQETSARIFDERLAARKARRAAGVS
ncbi:acyl-ACP desaturase [Kibdelosporangium aridum]|uniref:acyl-ACP desaturase n=1 Tax=Kibdelosporangium aridum TaxID=2030 RepID=UPI0006892940